MYVKLIDGIPEKYALRTLRKANPNTSFPEDPTDDLMEKWGLYIYLKEGEPIHDKDTQIVEHQGYRYIAGAYRDYYNVRDKTAGEMALDLYDTRERMGCSAVDGQLELGEDNWAKVLEYRDQEYVAAADGHPAQEATTWRERIVINGSTHWKRNSQEIKFIGYLIGFNDEQMDAMFIKTQNKSFNS